MNNNKRKWDEVQPAIKKRPLSIKEKIQQWKKQRDNLLSNSLTQIKNDDLNIKKIEIKLIKILQDKTLNFPVDFPTISALTSDFSDKQSIKELLVKFSVHKLIDCSEHLSPEGENILYVTSVDYRGLQSLQEEYAKLIVVQESSDSFQNKPLLEESEQIELSNATDEDKIGSFQPNLKKSLLDSSNSVDKQDNDSVECILSLQSTKEKETKKISEEILKLLSKPTAKEESLMEQFRSANGQVQEFCPCGTREECKRVNRTIQPCTKLHFLKIIQKHTDESLGDCSFLNTCFHMDSCKYVHYRVEVKDQAGSQFKNEQASSNSSSNSAPLVKTLATATEQPFKRVLFPPQWMRCDLRYFDMSILGKFAVVMADPPWDIHMELPYGTMSDDEMRNLNIPCLQDEGLIFLWVTGRAMELGRECLKLWGYERCDEVIWVKTNQLQRLIRTGRTGHWINHGKEHCLVGVKGNPKNLNRGLDCDVIVAEVRATSHKPDEIYGIIERLSPGTRKIELFGRQHNTQPNWVTLGNQLNCVRLVDPQLIEAYKKRYPDAELMVNSDDD